MVKKTKKKNNDINESFESLKKQLERKKSIEDLNNKYFGVTNKENKITNNNVNIKGNIDIDNENKNVYKKDYNNISNIENNLEGFFKDNKIYSSINLSTNNEKIDLSDSIVKNIEIEDNKDLDIDYKKVYNEEESLENNEKIIINIVDDKNENLKRDIDLSSNSYDVIEKNSVSKNKAKIIIKKVEKEEAPKRITYYLKEETIKKIDKFSKLAGMGKSEFVQKILEEILNNLEIEK